MAKATTLETIGSYLFLLGIIIAIIGAFLTGYEGILVAALAVFGLIVGLLNVTDKEIDGYLIAAIALILLGASVNEVLKPYNWTWLINMFNYITVFAAFGAIIPALKKIYAIAAEK